MNRNRHIQYWLDERTDELLIPQKVGSTDKHLKKFIKDVEELGKSTDRYASEFVEGMTCPVCGGKLQLNDFGGPDEYYGGDFFHSTEFFTCEECGSVFSVTSFYRRKHVYVSDVTLGDEED